MRFDLPLATTPEQIQEVAIGIILSKSSRRRTALRNYHRLLHLEERKLRVAVDEWMGWTAKTLQAGLGRMKGKSTTAKVNSLADWADIRAHGGEIMKPALYEALIVGGNSVMGQRIKKQERFDPIGVEALRWTTEHSAVLVVQITEETMLAIRTYITAGIEAGKSIQKIAMELRPLVGLTSRDIMAVANYHEMLILERPEYTVATQREMAETYAKRLHRRRATTIARTETAEALTEGQRQGYKQMGIKRLMRVEDPDCCDICLEYDGQIYTIAEARGMLPEHPNCLLGSTLISTCDFITGAMKRWYDGEVIIISTASGETLTATPNHPILSDMGWIPINFLNLEDNVISLDIRHFRFPGVEQNINYMPSPIEQIVETFFLSDFTTTKETPITTQDFHGDVPSNSQIAIIGANSFLRNSMNSLSAEGRDNGGFIRPNSTLPNFTSFSPSQSFGKSNWPPMVSTSNRSSFGQGNESFPRLETQSFGARSVDPGFLNYIINPRRTRPVNSSDFISRQSRFIKLDKIVSIHTEHYIGYVYNLQTENHWYIANGIATHNCEGTWIAAP